MKTYVLTIMAIITAAMAVFAIGSSLTLALSGYPIGWVMLVCSLIIANVLFVDGLKSLTEEE